MKILVGKRQSGKTTAAKEWSKSFSAIWLHTKQPGDWFEDGKLPTNVNLIQHGMVFTKDETECVILESDFCEYELYRDDFKQFLFNNCPNDNVCIVTQHVERLPTWVKETIVDVQVMQHSNLNDNEAHLLQQLKDAINGDEDACKYLCLFSDVTLFHQLFEKR